MKELSVFVDESGDFGKVDNKNPFYILTLVLHNQKNELSATKLNWMDEKLQDYFPTGAKTYVHAGPIIRKEKEFKDVALEDRRHILNALFYFAISENIQYVSLVVDKRNCNGEKNWLHNQLVKQMNVFITEQMNKLSSFENVKLYYDLGQKEITNMLNTVFSLRLQNFSLGNTEIHEYRLFQVADLICTLELLNLKKNTIGFTKSETVFFESAGKFNKNYYKKIIKKKIGYRK